jgi:hypothetical protein
MSFIMDENKQEKKWLVVKYKVPNGLNRIVAPQGNHLDGFPWQMG